MKSDCRGTTTEAQTTDIPPETERRLVERLRRSDESALADRQQKIIEAFLAASRRGP
jgi:hypothetical protein